MRLHEHRKLPSQHLKIQAGDVCAKEWRKYPNRAQVKMRQLCVLHPILKWGVLKMLRPSMLSLVGLCFASSIAYAGTYEAEIKTHAMTGAVNVVEGAVATLVSSDAGIAGSFATGNLEPGHVYTLWVAIMNEPRACAMDSADHCTSADVLERSDAVNSDVTYGDGVIVPADGMATFRTFIPAGELDYSWLGNGLTKPTSAEIHFALHDHGPMIPGKLYEMMSTAREGCTEESLPGLWPASARASGNAGPNQCTMAQFAIFQQQ